MDVISSSGATSVPDASLSVSAGSVPGDIGTSVSIASSEGYGLLVVMLSW